MNIFVAHLFEMKFALCPVIAELSMLILCTQSINSYSVPKTYRILYSQFFVNESI